MVKITGPDAAEYRRLEESVTRIDKLLAGNAPDPLAAGSLAQYAMQCRMRMETIEEKVRTQEEERLGRTQNELAAAMAAKETRLTESERQVFRSFMEKDYFTKADFGALAGFYQSAYDRLSETGKDAMGERILNGIKRGEFRREEMPNIIREKEDQRSKSSVHVQKATPSTGSLKCELKEMPGLDDVAGRLTPPLSGAVRSSDGKTGP